MLIQHITTTTGHAATHRLDTLDPHAVEACRKLLPAGGQVPGFSAFRVDFELFPMFLIWRGRDPIVACSVGRGHDEAWSGVTVMHKQLHGPLTITPPPGQWLAVVLLPGIRALARKDVAWLADFERCMAAAMLLP